MSAPYANLLDAETTVRLQSMFSHFDRKAKLSALRQIGELPSRPGDSANDNEAFFRRELEHFARATREDYALRAYLASEADALARAITICGKLTQMPSFAYYPEALAVLLALEGASIWLDDKLPT